MSTGNTYKQIFTANGNGGQDCGTLFSLASEFLEAARTLQATPPVRMGYSAVIYYLLGHATELLLKSFLYSHGQTVKDLRAINHDIEKLMLLAKQLDLPENVSFLNIESLSNAYMNKTFEYRMKRIAEFPSIDLLINEVLKLQSFVFERLTAMK